MPIKQPAFASTSPHITAAGQAALQAELEYLWSTQRPTITAAVAAAAAMGDRSENAEYIYGKKQLREIDRRVRYLRKRLAQCVVVDTLPADTARIYFGAWVSLRDAAGAVNCYRIVGADEIDPQRGWISIDSPLARALLRKRVGESAVVSVPNGVDARKWLILTIDYTPPAEKNNA